MSHDIRTVLVVDDSAVVREAVRRILDTKPGWSVHVAADGMIALEKIRKEKPDVILLDLEMPRMDGLTLLRHIMATDPIPVVVCSGYADYGTERAAIALELGAVDLFPKPKLSVKDFLEGSGGPLEDVLLRASEARVRLLRPGGPTPLTGGDGSRGARPGAVSGVDRARSPSVRGTEPARWEAVVLLGASLGGPEAIRTVLESFPADGPPCVMVQHMLQEFTGAFVTRLNSRVRVDVRLAEDGQAVEDGRVLVAPGGKHLRIEARSGGRSVVHVSDEAPVRGHRPSIDVLFESAAEALGGSVVAGLLTGMGGDGARGLRALRLAGARTLVQNEETCTVFGMPSAALALDAAEQIVPLGRIGPRLLALAEARSVGSRPGAER